MRRSPHVRWSVLAFVLFLLPASRAGGQVSDSQFVADSLQVMRAIAEADSEGVNEAARRERAESLLTLPVRFQAGSVALDSAAVSQVVVKAWYLYLNPRLKLVLSGHADAGLTDAQAVTQARRRVDAVRKVLAGREVSQRQVAVVERLGAAPDSVAGTVGCAVTGDFQVLEVPPADAAPPRPEKVAGLVGPAQGRTYRWGIVRVYYATDRARLDTAHPERFYGPEQSTAEGLELGRLEVSIPRVHRKGVVERPAWYQIDRTANPDRHLILKSVTPLGERATLDSIRRTVDSSGSKEALVFIHGYNVSFHDAALRTAQLTYDLGFDGAPILYSWPSRGSLFRYSSDRESAEWSAAHLRTFLDALVAITGARRIHVIAHSMGNRVLSLALESHPPADTLFSNLVLAAPDVDATRFEQQIAASIRRFTQRMTIYMSRKDNALRMSRWLSTHRRLGEATDPIVLVRDTDTIDASELDTDLLGHGYVASNRDLIDDLVLLLGQKRSPPRARLRRTAFNGREYWLLP